MRNSLAHLRRFFTQKIVILAAFTVIAAFLPACSTLNEKSKPACPKVALLAATGTIERKDLKVDISDLGYGCNVKDSTIETDLDIGFIMQRFTKTAAQKTDASYFVAYILADDTIVRKGVFPLTLQITPDKQTLSQTEHIHLVIPYDKDKAAGAQVLIGFQNHAANAVR